MYCGRLCPILKPRVKDITEEFIPLVVQNFITKIFEAILLTTLQTYRTKQDSEWQTGFTKGYNTLDNFYHIKRLIKEEYNIVFLDFSSGFNMMS